MADPSFESLTSEVTDTPPSSGGGAKATAARPTITQIEKRVKQLYALPALPLMMKCEHCATHYAENCEKAAESLINLAKTNPRVRRILEGLVQGSTMAEVAVTHLTLIVPILIHHDAITIPPFFASLFNAPDQHVHSSEQVGEVINFGPGVMPEDPSATRVEDDTAFSLE